MNKNKIIYYVCIAFLMACIGISLAITVNYKYESEKVMALKNVLMTLEENNSTKKGYEISFVKNVDYNDKEDANDAIADYNAHYEAKGSFKLSYEESGNKVNLMDGFQSFFQNAKGFISGTQVESHTINNIETDKNNNGTIRKENFNYSVSNEFVIDNNSDISVLSNTKYNNNIDNTKNVNDSFLGKINKNLLFETIDISRFNDAVNQLMFIDVWDDATSLLKLISSSLDKIDYNNRDELADFIKNKDFSFQINNDTIKINYLLDLDDKLNYNDNNYECIKFMLEVDKNSKEIKHFSFDLTKYYESILRTDENDQKGTSKVNQYIIEGKILNNTLDKEDTSGVQYKEYNDETKYDFIDQFITHAIPTREDIY